MGKKKYAVSDEEIRRRFSIVDTTYDQDEDMKTIDTAMRGLALAMNLLLPEGREKALTLTRIEEAYYWAVASVLSTSEEES